MFLTTWVRTRVIIVTAGFICSFLFLKANAQISPTDLLKNYVSTNQQKLRLAPLDTKELVITKDYVDKTTGIRHTYATQKLNGLVITNAVFSLHTKKTVQMEANNLVPLSEYATSPLQVNLRAEEAINKVFDAIKTSDRRSLQLKLPPTGTDSYTVFKRTEDKVLDVPCRLVYYNVPATKQLLSKYGNWVYKC